MGKDCQAALLHVEVFLDTRAHPFRGTESLQRRRSLLPLPSVWLCPCPGLGGHGEVPGAGLAARLPQLQLGHCALPQPVAPDPALWKRLSRVWLRTVLQVGLPGLSHWSGDHSPLG